MDNLCMECLTAARYGHLERQLAEARKAFELIAEQSGLCIYSHDEAFREGSNKAFNQCAEIAATGLAANPEGTDEAR